MGGNAFCSGCGKSIGCTCLKDARNGYAILWLVIGGFGVIGMLAIIGMFG